jgi:hypothetical protein
VLSLYHVIRVHTGRRVPVGRWRENREGEQGGMWFMYVVYVYENRTTELVEIVLRRGERG